MKYIVIALFVLGMLATPVLAREIITGNSSDFKPKLLTVLKDCWDITSRCIGAGCGCESCADCYYYEDGTKKCKDYREICGD